MRWGCLDARVPRNLAHIPGEEGLGEAGGAQMVRVCAGRELPRREFPAMSGALTTTAAAIRISPIGRS